MEEIRSAVHFQMTGGGVHKEAEAQEEEVIEMERQILHMTMTSMNQEETVHQIHLMDVQDVVIGHAVASIN